MTTLATRPGPNGRTRPSLGDQLDRLDGILSRLSDALNQSVTAAVSPPWAMPYARPLSRRRARWPPSLRRRRQG
jgi:hypothetical protein